MNFKSSLKLYHKVFSEWIHVPAENLGILMQLPLIALLCDRCVCYMARVEQQKKQLGAGPVGVPTLPEFRSTCISLLGLPR